MAGEQLFHMMLFCTQMELVGRVTASQTRPCKTSAPSAKSPKNNLMQPRCGRGVYRLKINRRTRLIMVVTE